MRLPGYDLTIYNRSNSERVRALEEKGANLANCPAAVAAKSDIVFHMVRISQPIILERLLKIKDVLALAEVIQHAANPAASRCLQASSNCPSLFTASMFHTFEIFYSFYFGRLFLISLLPTLPPPCLHRLDIQLMLKKSSWAKMARWLGFDQVALLLT